MHISSTRVKITVNTLAQFVGRIISSGTTFILTILLAHALGTEGYGDFSKIVTYVSFFYLFADFGMNAAFLQLKEEDKRFHIGHLISSRLILSILLTFISISLLSFFPQQHSQGYTPFVRFSIIIYSLSILAQALVTTMNAVFQEKLRYEFATIAVIGGALFRLGSTYVFGTGSVLGAIFCFLFGAVVNALIAFFLAKKIETTLSPTFSLKHSLKLFKTAFPLGITLVFNLIYFRVDSILLTLTQPTQDVGIYNLAYSFFEFALVLPLFFMNALYPLFLKQKSISMEAFFLLAKKAGLVLFIASFIVAIALWIGAPTITLIKPEFAPGIDVLHTLSLSIPFFFLTNLTMWIMITLNKKTALVVIYGCSMIFNIVANIIFLPKLGFIAAAWITVIGEGIVLVLSSFVLISHARQILSLRRILTS